MKVEDFEQEYVLHEKLLGLPKTIDIVIEPLRINSIFQFNKNPLKIIAEDGIAYFQNQYTLKINALIIPFNSKEDILAAFRHELIYIYQYEHFKNGIHSKDFKQLAKQIHAIDPRTLTRPKSKYKTYYYICPGCKQQFSTPDNPVVICEMCGTKMDRLNSNQYKKFRAKQRENIKAVREGLK